MSKHKTRLNQGLCGKCGKNPLLNGKSSCQSCKDRKQLQKLNKIESGLCTRCSNRAIEGKTVCQDCANRKKTLRDNRTNSGTCIDCKNKTTESVRCIACSLKQLAHSHTGDRNNAEVLGLKLFEQNLTCPYSGVRIEVNKRASIDHKIPKSKGGSSNIDNLEWVHEWVNFMKRNDSKEEFEKEFIHFVKTAYQFLQEKEEIKKIFDSKNSPGM